MEKFVGLRLYNDRGARRLDAILTEGAVRLVLTAEDAALEPGYYSLDWLPLPDPTEAAP